MTDLILEPLTTAERYEPAKWQEEHLAKLTELPYSANWSEMGCYKTTSGLWLMDRLRKKEGKRGVACLVVTSKGGKGPYYDAFPKTLPDWRMYTVDRRKITERIDDVDFPVDAEDLLQSCELGYLNYPTILLAHFECFQNNSAVLAGLKKIPWFMVLVDEAHRIKNRELMWTRNIKRLNTKYKHVMTGSGFVNRPDEIYSLLNFLDKNRWSSYWRFREYFCDEFIDQAGYRHILGLNTNRVAEFRQLREDLGPNHKLEEVRKDIPKPNIVARLVDLNPTQRRMYNEIRSTLQTMDQQGLPISSPNVLSQLNRLRQVCIATPEVVDQKFDPVAGRIITQIKLTEPSSKLDDLMDVIDELRWDSESKQQIVVFCSFKDPLYLLEARLGKKNIPYIHMEEKHSTNKRYQLWHNEFPQKNHQVFMSTVQLGGESINLTPAAYMGFLDRDWSPKNTKQPIGRGYRPGQTQALEVIHFQAVDTIDQRIERLLAQKDSWFDAIFG